MTAKKPTISSNRRTFVKGTGAAAAASTFFIGRSAKAEDPEHIMKIATVAPPGTPWTKFLKFWKKKIKEGSEGRIKVKTYVGGAKGGEIQTAEETKRGSLQIFAGTGAALASAVPELNVLELPYLFPTAKKADRILDEVIREDLDRLLWDRGYKLLFFSENGYRSIGSTFPVTSPDDLKGRKMRSQESEVHLNSWRAMGASPVPITVTEVLSSLQTNVVDGFDNTPLFAFAASWYQAITHFTLTKHIYQAGIVVASRKFWEGLPPDLQAVVLGDPAKYAKKGRRGVRAIGGMLEANFEGAGVTLSRLTDAQRKPFAANAEEVWDKFRKATSKDGKALLDKILKNV